MGRELKQVFPFDLLIPASVSESYKTDPQGTIQEIHDSLRTLAAQLSGRFPIVLAHAASPGDLIHIQDDGSGGTEGILADPATTKLAHGVLVGNKDLSSGDSGEVQAGNLCTYPAGGLVIGSTYYLAASGSVSTVILAAGQIQAIGIAITTSMLFLNLDTKFS